MYKRGIKEDKLEDKLDKRGIKDSRLILQVNINL